MGQPDQLLKAMLEYEAPRVTHDAAVFVRAPEIATSELRPDGLLVTHTPERLRTLPAPWCLLEREAVLDGKMPGDHLDPAAFERCLLRRFARQVQRIEQESADPAPAHCAAWIVAPHWPAWLHEWETAGHLALKVVAPGCLQLGPWPFGVLWIAANELPLHDALTPFLLARSGTKLREFMRWVMHLRPPAWLAGVVYSLPEVAAMFPQFTSDLSPEDHRVLVENFKKILVALPELGEDIWGQGMAPLVRQFERRLGRTLSDADRQTLRTRLATVGAERLGDVVLDLSAEQLGVWLADPDAR